MICSCIGSGSIEDIELIISQSAYAELRLDMLNLTLEETEGLFRRYNNLIATYRGDDYRSSVRKQSLKTAIRAGAAFVDIETEAPEDYLEELIRDTADTGCKVIVSYHNFENTPDFEELSEIAETCLNQGGEIAKIAVTANSEADAAKLMSLYPYIRKKGDLIAVAMGKTGTITRVAAPLLGAPFTFAVPEGSVPTAPGQLGYKEISDILVKLK